MFEFHRLEDYPATLFKLNGTAVHLWQASLDVPGDVVEALAKVLSSDEKARAERFVFDEHRRRFIVARGVLRTVLGRYLNVTPAGLSFEYGAKGKPEVAIKHGAQQLYFNLSHSDDVALYAFARGRVVGVDVERLCPERDVEGLAEYSFSSDEFAVIRGLPVRQKRELFFKAWTVKEAYLKATGEGLSGMETVELAFSSNGSVALKAIQGDADAAGGWSARQVNPVQGYVGALVVQGHDWVLNQ